VSCPRSKWPRSATSRAFRRPCDIRRFVVTNTQSKPDRASVPASESPATSISTTSPTPQVQHDDVALIHGRTEDGRGLKILRRRNDRIEAGAVMPLEAGKPIAGEVVRLEPRKESPLLCDVHVEYTPPQESRPTATGPAQVASDRYRQNWDLVFGGAHNDEPALN
jgi:hypothetical protein